MQDLDSSMEFLLFPSPNEKKGVFIKLELRAGPAWCAGGQICGVRK